MVSFASTQTNGIVPHRINGISLKQRIIDDVSFQGYSGDIQFSPGRPHYSRYGVGDRTAGVRFIFSNFNPGNGSMNSFSLSRVGTWTTETGFSVCGTDSTLQSKVTGGCTFIQYGTPDNIMPSDRPAPISLKMTAGAKGGLYFLAAVNFVVVLFFMRILITYRNTRLLKASQPTMTWIIVTANLFGICRIVLAGVDISGESETILV